MRQDFPCSGVRRALGSRPWPDTTNRSVFESVPSHGERDAKANEEGRVGRTTVGRSRRRSWWSARGEVKR